MFLIVGVYGTMLIVSIIYIRKAHSHENIEWYEDFLHSKFVKPVSILVPAYNESVNINQTIHSLLNIKYPEYEIIVINDGSTDDTLQKLIVGYDCVQVNRIIRKHIETEEVKAIYQSTMYPNLLIIDKVNGGKADALNAGVNVSQYPYFGALDSDSMIESNAFIKVLKPILESNERIIGAGGSVRIANGSIVEAGQVLETRLPNKPLVIMQIIEYLRAFLIGRIGLSHKNLLLIVSGAFGVFEKRWVIEIGGYQDSLGEDMEIVVRLHRHMREINEDKEIAYVPDSVCWTEAPESIKYLRKQRHRWQKGLFMSLWRHRKLMLNPKYGTLGMISMPYYFLIEFLSPFIELTGYMIIILSFVTGHLTIEFTLLFLSLSMIYGSIFSTTAVLLEEWSMERYPKIKQFIKLFLWSLTESLWYRPLTVIWRIGGMIGLLFGYKGWGEMERKGVSNE